MIRTLLSSVAVTLVLVAGACATDPQGNARSAATTGGLALEGADLVLIGTIRTMDATVPEGTALVVRGSRIERVTDEATALQRVGPNTRVVRLPAGACVLPGLIESHAHLRSLGRAAREIRLNDCPTAEAAAARVAEVAATTPAGQWILGRGWNQENWSGHAFPTHEALDGAAPHHPVALTRTDGHALWCNQLALTAAKITATSVDPAGGEIVRGASGAPTGVLVDNAMDAVAALETATPDPAVVVGDLLRAQTIALSHGITTFVDAGDTATNMVTLSSLYDDARFKLRVYGMIGCAGKQDIDNTLISAPFLHRAGDRFTVRAIKLYGDGALGSRGARLLEPYADRPDHPGLTVSNRGLLEYAATRCLARGWQLCVHAIGDRANREVLDAIEAALKTTPARDHRFRVEHAQLVDPVDAQRFAALGVIPSVQPCHAVSDAPWVPARLGGERAARIAYPWRTLIDAGSRPPAGTDAPVEDISPLANLYAAVTRMDAAGSLASPFLPEQRMNRLEALFAMTRWGAYACFSERSRGRIAPGLDADLTVVSADLATCPASAIPTARTLMTIIDGEVVFEAQ